jgi:chemotaxis protein MotA
MDLATVIGLVGALGLLIAAMALGVGVGAYIDPQSVLIVILGSIMSLMVSYKMDMMTKFLKVFMIAIKPNYQPNYEELIKKLVDYATQARRDGILSLESAANNEEDEFLKKKVFQWR